MLRKASEAVPEGNDPIPPKEELGSGQPTMEDVYRRIKLMMSHFEEPMDEISDVMDQHLTRLEHGARQPRLAMEANGQADTRTRERTEGAATAVQAMRGDCFSARRVESGPTTNSTSFGVKAEPPALPCGDDVVVESGPAASESCLPSMEMRPSTAAGGLVPTGDASNASETTSNKPPLRFCPIEKTDLKAKNLWTSVPSASYNSSSFRRLSATPYCRRIVDIKSGQNRTFGPGGSRGHLRACPFLGPWRALVCDEDLRAGASSWNRAAAFFRWFAGSLEKGWFWCRAWIKSRRRGRLAATGTRGRIRGHDVMATWGDWKLGANGCRGASWSDESFGANCSTATPRSGLLLSERLRTSRTQDHLRNHMLCWKVYSCAAVGSTVTCHVTILCV